MNYVADVGTLLVTLVLIGFLCETVVELLKQALFTKVKPDSRQIYLLSIVVGLILAFALEVSIFSKDNQFAYYTGIVISGLIASRGSNYVHNWIGNLPSVKK